MAYEFYTNMVKRADGKVYADLHKTDGKIYYNAIDAERAILLDAETSASRHVVPLVALTLDEYEAMQDALAEAQARRP